jgi:hypothetical protein
MQLALGSARLCSSFTILSWFMLHSAYWCRVLEDTMLKMSFLGPYDVAEILMLIASVVVVAAILVAI